MFSRVVVPSSEWRPNATHGTGTAGTCCLSNISILVVRVIRGRWPGRCDVSEGRNHVFAVPTTLGDRWAFRVYRQVRWEVEVNARDAGQNIARACPSSKTGSLNTLTCTANIPTVGRIALIKPHSALPVILGAQRCSEFQTPTICPALHHATSFPSSPIRAPRHRTSRQPTSPMFRPLHQGHLRDLFMGARSTVAPFHMAGRR